jgi:hypothetical protein
VATVPSASDDVAAQGFNNDPSAIESAWSSGYMGLGGGLIRAMPKHEHHKEKETEKAEVSPRPSSPSHKRHVRVQRRVPSSSPVALVANTLDHTGLNIANLGTHAEPR